MEMGARVNRIVRRIMVNNPGRSVPSVKVKSFRTAKEVGSWIFSRDCFDRDLRTIIGDFNFNWIIRLKEFRHPARDHLSAMSLFAPALFLVFSMFGFVLQISALVTEKELKLRQAMSMMGLCESTYWLSWIVSEGILCCSCKKSLPYHTLRVSPLDSQQVLLMITVGTRLVGIPGRESPDNPRGIMFEVYWETDDTGSLCISGSVSRNACSSKHPTIDANNCTGEASLAGDDQRPVYGLVIDANQVTQ
ncbi:ABC transporter A family member 11 [Linum perenne]